MDTSSSPTLLTARNNGNDAAIIFVHGFQGSNSATWESFIRLMLQDINLEEWDIYSVGYPTSLSVDLHLWSDDPDLDICAIGLATTLRHAPLDRYRVIALVAHSMGGLVVQKAIVDNNDLVTRLSHAINFGTPSGGTKKGALGGLLKKQARDMTTGSDFLVNLRAKWKEKIGDTPPFLFQAVAGDKDAFIPPESSIGPFPASQQSVVPGNHLEIVRPESLDDLSYTLLYQILSNSRGDLSSEESARLAVEQKDYEKAIGLLLPGADGLDANAIVTLALALDSVGRKEESIAIIERWNKASGGKSLDALGVLAGRLKRRWQVNRQQQDYDRSLELYSEGLAGAEESGDENQAYYHAINIAYMRLAAVSPTADIPGEAKEMAKNALNHAKAVAENQWSLATIGEANLMLENPDEAINAYEKARDAANTLRELDSMQSQAVSVAERVFGEEDAKMIDRIFSH